MTTALGVYISPQVIGKGFPEHSKREDTGQNSLALG